MCVWCNGTKDNGIKIRRSGGRSGEQERKLLRGHTYFSSHTLPSFLFLLFFPFGRGEGEAGKGERRVGERVAEGRGGRELKRREKAVRQVGDEEAGA